jgi:UPF0755 protein
VNPPKLQINSEKARQLILLLILLVAWTGVIYLFAPTGDSEKRIVIKPGASTAQIARQLHREGIISSQVGFQIIAKLEGVSGKLKAGNYLISGRLTPWQVARRLARGSVDIVTITIPEGFTAQQIASLAEKNGICTKGEFLKLARSPNKELRELAAGLPAGKSLEGFLFPDTYRLDPGADGEELIALMLKRFSQVAPAALSESSLSFYETVILGSIIEKEAKLQKERPLISAVFHNRLQKGMRLQSCATVAYALNKSHTKLSYKDLELDSPYNTYRKAGLPPEPISNPGLASLRAAARPAKVDYLYFFALGDGSHHFSRTYKEHLELQKP